MQRYLEKQVRKDLGRKMVFIGGPRQVGKTTLSYAILGQKSGKNHPGYLNWDIDEDRTKILAKELPLTDIWVFDEIHKFRRWRNFLKGLYDQYHDEKSILVTGSARLDYYRFGGDSLQGRYHYLRLHPLSLAELNDSKQDNLEALLHLGGFPEPFLGGSKTESKRWSRDYHNRLIRDELTSLERVEDIGTLEMMSRRLPELVASPLSINALREDLQVSHKTVARWLEILERLYAIFRLPPFGAPKIRAVKKEQKHYHFDWTLIQDPSKCFENLVACHLLKWVHFEQDSKGRNLELRYFRDIDLREVDFVVVEDATPILCVECKWQPDAVTKGLNYFKQRFPSCDAWQIHFQGNKDYLSKEKIRVAPATVFLATLT